MQRILTLCLGSTRRENQEALVGVNDVLNDGWNVISVTSCDRGGDTSLGSAPIWLLVLEKK